MVRLTPARSRTGVVEPDALSTGPRHRAWRPQFAAESLRPPSSGCRRLVRRRLRQTLVATRRQRADTAPSDSDSFRRSSSTNTSCMASTAAASSRSSRRQRRNTMGPCCRYAASRSIMAAQPRNTTAREKCHRKKRRPCRRRFCRVSADGASQAGAVIAHPASGHALRAIPNGRPVYGRCLDRERPRVRLPAGPIHCAGSALFRSFSLGAARQLAGDVRDPLRDEILDEGLRFQSNVPLSYPLHRIGVTRPCWICW